MLKIICLSFTQSIILVAGQVLLKYSMVRLNPSIFGIDFWKNILSDWRFISCGVCYGIATLLWLYIVKHYPLSIAYPMISLSYALGMVASMVFFHEGVNVVRWIGIALIMAGCCLVARN